MQSSPSTLTLKLSTNRSSSSASVEAPGSSIWIQSAPSAISASRFGRMMLRAMSRVSSRRASISDRRPYPAPMRPSRGVWCSSYDQTASV